MPTDIKGFGNEDIIEDKMMNTYKVKYIFKTEFEAGSDKEAKEIVAKNADAIVKNGEFMVKELKIKMDIYADKEDT